MESSFEKLLKYLILEIRRLTQSFIYLTNSKLFHQETILATVNMPDDVTSFSDARHLESNNVCKNITTVHSEMSHFITPGCGCTIQRKKKPVARKSSTFKCHPEQIPVSHFATHLARLRSLPSVIRTRHLSPSFSLNAQKKAVVTDTSARTRKLRAHVHTTSSGRPTQVSVRLSAWHVVHRLTFEISPATTPTRIGDGGVGVVGSLPAGIFTGRCCVRRCMGKTFFRPGFGSGARRIRCAVTFASPPPTNVHVAAKRLWVGGVIVCCHFMVDFVEIQRIRESRPIRFSEKQINIFESKRRAI